MARKKEVQLGFVLGAIDNASKVVHSFAKGAEKAWSTLGHAITVLDHAVNLAARGWNFLEGAIRSVISTSLDFRGKNDEVHRSFEAFEATLRSTEARLGDEFLPTLVALADTFKPVLEGVRAWLVANRELVATGVLEWTVTLGKVLSTTVLSAVQMVGLAFYGWRAIFDTIESGAAVIMASLLGGLRDILASFASVASLLPERFSALAKALGAARDGVGALADRYVRGGNVIRKDLASTTAAIASLNKKVDEGGTSAFDFFNRVMVVGLRKVQTIGAGLNLDMEKRNAILDIALQKQQLLNASFAETERFKNILKPHVESFGELVSSGEDAAQTLQGIIAKEDVLRAKIEAVPPAARDASDSVKAYRVELEDLGRNGAVAGELIQKALEAVKQKVTELIAQATQFGDAIGSAFGQLAAGAISSGQAFKAVAKAALSTIRDVVVKSITAYAAQSAAEAFAAHAAIPFIGPALGAAAAAAAFSFVIAYLDKFHTGGVVPGAGERPIMAMGGEEVLTTSDPRHRRNLGTAGGGGSLSLTLVQQNFVPDSPAEFSRKLRPLKDVIQEWISSGEIVIPAATRAY